jgi:hypothetical protein
MIAGTYWKIVAKLVAFKFQLLCSSEKKDDRFIVE